MERLVASSIRRPVLVTMVVLAVLLVGAVSLSRMGLDLFPDLELPVVAVLAIYPGASPQAVEQEVTAPLESALATLPGVAGTSSITRESLSLVLVELNWGTDVSLFVNDVNQTIQRLRLTLPESVEPPVVWRLDPTQLPIAMYGLAGSHNDDPARLSRLARERVVPLLERVDGVGRVVMSGATTPEVQVRYEPAALAQVGLTPAQLVQLIAYQNVEVPAGAITDRGRRLEVRVGNRLRSLDDLRRLPVAILRPGQPGAGFLPRVVTLEQVAEVERVDRAPEGLGRLNGRPSLLISVFKESEQNTVTVSRRIRRAIAEAGPALDGAELVPIYVQADFIEQSLLSVTRNGALGGMLAVVLLYLFLSDVWSTFAIAVAIPISLLATLVLMYLNGLTLNLMSLGGLGLGIGMLVDNSIVVLENIFRHAQQGEPPEEAAVRGTAEVGMAISASTFTTLVVFLPVIFVGGLAGRIFRELALTVSFSLLASLAVAMMVTPALAVRLRLTSNAALARRVSTLAARRRGGGARWFDPVRRAYRTALRACVRRPAAALSLAAAAVAVAALVYPRVDVEFLTPVDVGQLSVTVELPPGTPLERTDEASRRLEAYLMQLPEARAVAARVGSAGSDDLLSAVMADDPWVSNVYLVLRPRGERSRSAARLAAELRQELPRVLGEFPGARIRVSDSPSFGLLSEFVSERVTVDVFGPDPVTLAELAERIRARLDATPGLAGAASSLEARAPAVALQVDPGRALTGGLLAAQVGLAVREALQGVPAGTLADEDGRPIPVVVRAAPSAVGSLEALLQFPVAGLALPGTTPPRVRLDRVSVPAGGVEPASIQRRDGRRIATVTAELDGIGLGEAARRAEQALRSIQVPPGHEWRLSGIHELIAETFGDLWLALGLSVVLVYMVMAAQFESLLDPFIIMVTVPLGLAGGLVGLWLTGNAVSVTSILGGIVLAGIAVNNGIVMVDYINQVAARAPAWEDAVVEGAATRLRPVLMTALTTILGLVPLAVGWGEASELEVPLAVTVVGGMVLATGLTLFVVPVAKYLAGRLVRERRVPAAALSAASWALMLVAAGLLLLAFFMGNGRAAAAAADEPPSPARWWQGATLTLAAAHRPPGSWELEVSGRGRILRGALRGAELELAGAAGRDGAADDSRPFGQGGLASEWHLQAGGALRISRPLGPVGVAGAAAEARLQAAFAEGGASGGGGGTAVFPSGTARIDAMGRLEGTVALGNVAAGVEAWGATGAFRPWLSWTPGPTPAARAAASLAFPGSAGMVLTGQRRWGGVGVRLGAGVRYVPGTGAVLPHAIGAVTARLGTVTAELAAAGPPPGTGTAGTPSAVAAALSFPTARPPAATAAARPPPAPRSLHMLLWWEPSSQRLGGGLSAVF